MQVPVADPFPQLGFQSAPGFAAGRCSGERIRKLIAQRVSIRARLCSRAMRCGKKRAAARVWFQSAPGFAAGRCGHHGCHQWLFHRFNPRPALQPGDAPRSAAQRRHDSRFQSAPGFAAGRCATTNSGGISAHLVSIRARLCSRAMHDLPEHRHWVVLVSIRARLCSRAMPLFLSAFSTPCLFQSAPGFAAGRCFTLATHCCQSKFFPPAANLPDGC